LDASALILIYYFWRVIASVLASIAVASLVYLLVPGSSRLATPVLLFVGVGMGIYWQAQVVVAQLERGKKQFFPTVSKPIAFLSIAVLGGLLSGMAAHLFHSWLIAALVCVGAIALTGLWYKLIQRILITRPHLFLAAGFALGAVCGLAAIAWPPICGATECIRHL